MKFNPDITKQAIEVIFSCKTTTKPDHPPISFNNIPVSRESSANHLGIILDEKLKFRKHVDEKVKTANKGLGILRYLKKYANRKVLDKMYKMYVRPHLEYGDVVFHGQTKESCDRIESVQYRAALIVSGCWKGTNRIKLYNELGWESMYQRRHIRRLCLYYRIVNGLTPSYLNECIKEIPADSTNRYFMSFFPYCKAYWENLSLDIKLSPNINIFKKKLYNISRPIAKLVPNCDDKKNVSALTRLRVGHSDLRDDRLRHSFNCVSSLCTCNNIDHETAQHFLLKCSKYNSLRISLFTKLLILTNFSIIGKSDDFWTDLLLYGNNNFSKNINMRILDLTVDFIKSTKRFVKIEAYSNS